MEASVLIDVTGWPRNDYHNVKAGTCVMDADNSLQDMVVKS